MRGNRVSKIVAIGVVASFLLTIFAVLPTGTDGAVLAANKTEIIFDGEKIHGLKGFTYKVYKDRQDVRGIGMNERIGVVYGRLHVKGKILVHGNSELLNKHMDNNTHVEIIITFQQEGYAAGEGIQRLSLEGCRIERRTTEAETDIVTYTFTADRIREA